MKLLFLGFKNMIIQLKGAKTNKKKKNVSWMQKDGTINLFSKSRHA